MNVYQKGNKSKWMVKEGWRRARDKDEGLIRMGDNSNECL